MSQAASEQHSAIRFQRALTDLENAHIIAGFIRHNRGAVQPWPGYALSECHSVQARRDFVAVLIPPVSCNHAQI